MTKSSAYLTVTTIGIDLAKSVFQLHGVDASGQVVLQRKVRRGQFLALLRRLPPCLVGMEACATAHHWGRELMALGHDVRLIPPSYVKPYVRRQKNDMADAAAICEAVTRPSMRFVAVKSRDRQSLLMLHRVREQLVGQRTSAISALRGHLAEFGVVAPQGVAHLPALMAVVHDVTDARLPDLARQALRPLLAQIAALEGEIARLDKRILAWHRQDATSQRLASIPGVGPLTATAIVATVGDPFAFSSGRQLAAFFGLVPRQNSSGGKEKLGRITKMGDRYIRKLLVVGATAVLCNAKKDGTPSKAWAQALLANKPFKLVAVALANKTARIVWALMTRGGLYRPALAAPANS